VRFCTLAPLVDLSRWIFLMLADGQFYTVIQYQEKDATALAKLRHPVASIPRW